MKLFIKSLIMICMLSTAFLSHASQRFYFGANLGQANYDISLNDFLVLDDGSLSSANLSDSSTSIRFTLGYQLMPNLSLEGGYINLGEFIVSAISDGSGSLYPSGSVSIVAESDGFFLNIKGLTPLNEKFNLFWKFGLLEWDSDVIASDSSRSGTVKVDGNDAFFGIGASYIVHKDADTSLEFNVDYTFYELEELDVEVLSLGIQFGF